MLKVFVKNSLGNKFIIKFTLFKKGNPLDCRNYRIISLQSHVYNILMQFVYTRIKKDLIGALPIEEAAYQTGHSTIEQVQTM